MKLQILITSDFVCININIYVYINANKLLKQGFKVKWGISKLALRETQKKAISQSASYDSWLKILETHDFVGIKYVCLVLSE